MHSRPSGTRFLLFFLLAFTAGLRAQSLKFKHLNTTQGLSQSVVNCIYEDRRGFEWVGTQEGLNRYDGYAFKIFKHEPNNKNSIASNFIFSVYQDREGLFWIGTKDAGLDAYNEKTDRYEHFSNDTAQNTSISSNAVRCIYEDKAGNLWLGTEGGLNLLDRKTKKFQRFTADPNDPEALSNDVIYDIAEDNSGKIWLATYGGLNVFDPVAKKFHAYVPTSADYDSYFAQYHITNQRLTTDNKAAMAHLRALKFREDGKLWVGTDGAGLWLFDPAARKFESAFYVPPDDAEKRTGVDGLNTGRILDIENGSVNQLWLATFGGGLIVLEKNTGTYQIYLHDDDNPSSLTNNEIRCITQDRQGNMWLGHNSNGLGIYFMAVSNFQHYTREMGQHADATNLPTKSVMCFTEDEDSLLWVGTYGGGLLSLNRRTNAYTRYPKLATSSNNTILSLYADHKGTIWVGNYGGGLCRYDKKTGAIKVYNETSAHLADGTVLCIAEDVNGNIWFGTWEGLYKMNPTTETCTLYNKSNGLSDNTIFSLLFDRSNNLWVGTSNGGLNRLVPSTGEIKSYINDLKNPASISSNMVNCIYQDAKGAIWAGTAGGLNRLDTATGKFQHWFSKDGLLADLINGMLGDRNGCLWLSTNKGLSCFNPNQENEKSLAFRNYTTNDGLQDGEFNQGAYFKSKRGEMFFGGIDGFNAFFAESITRNENRPPIYITGLRVMDKPFAPDSLDQTKFTDITLDYKHNSIAIDFLTLDFVNAPQSVYAYKLEGLNNDWVYCGNSRIAVFANLEPGEYVFRVKGANHVGIWNEEGATFRITILPPFWKTKWFYALSVVLITIGVFGFIRLRTASIRREKAVLEQRVTERTHELAQKNKDITDSINYAKRIQLAILPALNTIFTHLPNTFVVYKPKDIVSGDFYWFAERNGRKIIAAVDCTGHGVPGAFMSMIGHNLLNQIVIENGIIEPAAILDALHEGVRIALKQGEHHGDSTDGMDVAICSIDPQRNEVQYAGALRPLIVLRKGILTRVEANRFSIGGVQLDENRTAFTNHTFFLDKGDTLYMFSDGYADQFGGERGKKFMVKRLLELLVSIQHLPMETQGRVLDETMTAWQGNFQQVDDILVVGIRL